MKPQTQENWEKAKARIWNLIKSYYPQNNLDLALELEQELNKLLSQSQAEAFKTITEELGLKVGDLPAFPPKGTDLIKLAVKIGKNKIKQKYANRNL